MADIVQLKPSGACICCGRSGPLEGPGGVLVPIGYPHFAHRACLMAAYGKAKFAAHMSPETAQWMNKFIAHNAHRMGSHGPMTAEVLIKLLLEDVAAAMRDGGDSWQGCHAAILLLEHGYRL